MSSSAPSSPFTGLSTTRQQDAVRVLVLLREAGDRPPPDPPRPDATACIQAESRLHALDFWLRNPDYLAFELLELNEQTPDVALVEQARRLIDDEERHFPMLRHLFGAYSELDGPLSLLRCYKLAWDVRRPASLNRRRDIYLLEKGERLLEDKLDAVPELAYYAERAQWVARVAGDRHGRALKDFQKRLETYREIRWGSQIAPVRDVVLTKLAELEGVTR
jgi:hypothetical protein